MWRGRSLGGIKPCVPGLGPGAQHYLLLPCMAELGPSGLAPPPSAPIQGLVLGGLGTSLFLQCAGIGSQGSSATSSQSSASAGIGPLPEALFWPCMLELGIQSSVQGLQLPRVWKSGSGEVVPLLFHCHTHRELCRLGDARLWAGSGLWTRGYAPLC